MLLGVDLVIPVYAFILLRFGLRKKERSSLDLHGESGHRPILGMWESMYHSRQAIMAKLRISILVALQ